MSRRNAAVQQGRQGPRVAPSRSVAAEAARGGTIRTVIPVAGMTCRSCEVRIQKFVARIPSVQSVEASAPRARVVIESSRAIPPRTIERAINLAGYEIGLTQWIGRDRVAWAEVGYSVMILVALALAAQVTGLAELASGIGDISSGGIFVALLLGLAAGVSTCAALIGGLVMALSGAFQAGRAARGEETDLATAMRPALVFMAGRILGYGVLGGLLGAVGANVAMPPMVTAALMIAVAALMTVLGTRLTGVSPRISGWSPTLPMGVSRKLGLVGDGPNGAYSDTRAAALGAASFFMPCGFTQAIQVFALSTGSPLLGGALLATFAIGTAPGLLALAGLPAVVSSEARPTLLRFVGVVVLGFALINGSAGFRLAGITLPFSVGTASAASLPAGAIAADGTQSLTTYQKPNGYSPSNVTIYSGAKTHWTIQSTNAAGCASALVVPSLNIAKRLRTGPNIIELPALKAGTLRYSCSMGMFDGTITIVDPPKASPQGTGG